MENSKTQNSAIPTGSIIAWTGQLVNNFDPTGRGINSLDGWALCNGNNETPDLQNRMVLGAGHNYANGQSGGNESITLSVNQMPAHTHTVENNGDHSHGINVNMNQSTLLWGAGGSGVNYGIENNLTTAVAGSHNHTLQTTGEGQAIDILPPFYALYYIMKLATE